MNKLPQEVFDLIIHHVDLSTLPGRPSQYALISRQWQHVVERRVFRELLVWATDFKLLGVHSRR